MDREHHLAIGRRADNIGGHHAQKDADNIASALVGHLRLEAAGIGGESDHILDRLSVLDTRAKQVNHRQADEDREQAASHVIEQRLAAEATECLAGTNPGDTDDDRGDHQRHDQHLQCIEKQRADELVATIKGDAENGALFPGQQAGKHRQCQGNQNLPV